MSPMVLLFYIEISANHPFQNAQSTIVKLEFPENCLKRCKRETRSAKTMTVLNYVLSVLLHFKTVMWLNDYYIVDICQNPDNVYVPIS